MHYKVFTTAFDLEISGHVLPPTVQALGSADFVVERRESLRGVIDQFVSARTDVAATLLIDHSGSMRGEPAAMAVCLADLITTLWARCSVPHEVLGFTTSSWKGGQSRRAWEAAGKAHHQGRICDLLHIVYRSFNDQAGSILPSLTTLMHTDYMRDGVDGEALMWAASRLQRRPEKHKLLLVISDLAPVDDTTILANGDAYLPDHHRATIAALAGDGAIRPAAIGVNCVGPLAATYPSELLTGRVSAETLTNSDLADVIMPFLVNLLIWKSPDVVTALPANGRDWRPELDARAAHEASMATMRKAKLAAKEARKKSRGKRGSVEPLVDHDIDPARRWFWQKIMVEPPENWAEGASNFHDQLRAAEPIEARKLRDALRAAAEAGSQTALWHYLMTEARDVLSCSALAQDSVEARKQNLQHKGISFAGDGKRNTNLGVIAAPKA
jgi:hypothetical protein